MSFKLKKSHGICFLIVKQVMILSLSPIPLFIYYLLEYKCNLFGDRCKVMVESIHSNDNGSTHNVCFIFLLYINKF